MCGGRLRGQVGCRQVTGSGWKRGPESHGRAPETGASEKVSLRCHTHTAGQPCSSCVRTCPSTGRLPSLAQRWDVEPVCSHRGEGGLQAGQQGGTERGAPNAQGIHGQDQGRRTGGPRHTAAPVHPPPAAVTSSLPTDASVCPRVGQVGQAGGPARWGAQTGSERD